MKRLALLTLAALLAVPTFGNADRRKQTSPGAYTLQGFDANGNPTVTTNYGGTRAGQAQDTGSAKVAEALANKMEADSEFAYVNLTRYAEDQPDVAIEQRLSNNEKGAASQLAAAVTGNAPAAVIAGIQNVLNTAIKERADYEKAKANRPKADTAGISITSFMNGPGSHSATALMGAKFGDTLAAKTRSNYVLSNETVRNDTSNSNDYRGVVNAMDIMLQMKKLDVELKKLDSVIKPPVDDAPPIVAPDPDDEEPVDPGASPEARHKALYPHVELTGGNAGVAVNHTLWKPISDQGDKELVVVTQHNLPKVSSLAIYNGSTLIKRMEISDVATAGNGYRLNWRFGGSGYAGTHRLLAVTADGTYGATITDGNKRQDNFQMKKIDAGGTVPPADPEPTPTPTGAFYQKQPAVLTLRADVARAVKRIDCLTNVTEVSKGKLDMAALKIVSASRSGDTWTIPQALEAYPSGKQANLWRIIWAVKPPAGVTYHFSIMQSFVRVGEKANTFYPPTTRS